MYQDDYDNTYTLKDLQHSMLLTNHEYFNLKKVAIQTYRKNHALRELDAMFLYSYGSPLLFEYEYGSVPYKITLDSAKATQWLKEHNEKHPNRTVKSAAEFLEKQTEFTRNMPIIQLVLKTLKDKGIRVEPRFDNSMGIGFKIPNSDHTVDVGRLIQFLRIQGGDFESLIDIYPNLSSNEPEPIREFLTNTFKELYGTKYKVV